MREKLLALFIFSISFLMCFTVNPFDAASAPSELDLSFNPVLGGGTGRVRTIVKQPDGKFLLGGDFKVISGKRHNFIGRLNADGTFDQSFNVGFGPDNYVSGISIQPDGKIIICGLFQNINGIARNRVARLNSDGSLDLTFNIGIGPDSLVHDVVALPDGKVIFAGDFTFFNEVFHPLIIRLNSDGSTDNSFVALNGGDGVEDVDVQPDGKIYITGTAIGANGQGTNGIARLNSNGSVDTSFNTGMGPLGGGRRVEEVEVLSNGKVLIGGDYSTFNGTNYGHLTLLNPDGSVDISFNQLAFSISDTIYSIAEQTDGKILIGGKFTSISGFRAAGIIRLNPNGTRDTSFDTNSGVQQEGTITQEVNSVIILSDGRIIIGGDISVFNNQYRYGFALFNSDATLSSDFSGGTLGNSSVSRLAIQLDGKIVIGGIFNTNGYNTRRIARLNIDGTTDTSFNVQASVSGFVLDLASQADGKIIVAGDFNRVNGVVRRYISRLNEDGSLDTTAFNQLPDNVVRDVVTQSDGKLIIAGRFIDYGGSPRRKIARLNSDTTLDISFNPGDGPNLFGDVYTVAIQPDGKVIVGGDFTTFGGVNRNRIARLNSDGTLDQTFNPGAGANNTIGYLAIQPDGKILAGGDFVTFNNLPHNRLVRLNPDGSIDTSFNIGTGPNSGSVAALTLQPDGKILVGGLFNSFNGISRTGLVRLLANGTIDINFANNLVLSREANESGDASVSSITLQANGQILVGGAFLRVNNLQRSGFIRLSNSMSLQGVPFDFDGDGKTDISIFRPSNGQWWYQQSSDNVTKAFEFGTSTDKPVPADYDGDGKTDVAFWRPSTGEWFVIRSSNLTFFAAPFGVSTDKPAPGDFDGDGKADFAVYRQSQGTWFILKSTGGVQTTPFGTNGDIPTVGDYDGDGKSDVAIYRPNGGSGGGEWWILRSSNSSVFATPFGSATDKPVPADYTGDGKTDVAFWRPSTGEWFVLRSDDLTFYAAPFGTNGDIPAPGDYDGDGKADLAVFRPSSATWFVLKSTGGTLIQGFGVNGDIPVPSAFVP